MLWGPRWRLLLLMTAYDLARVYAQPPPESNFCLAPTSNVFEVFVQPSPNPVCLLSEAPTHHLVDEFLSFEEWKSLKASEEANLSNTLQQGSNNSNRYPNDSSSTSQTLDFDADYTASSTHGGGEPLPTSTPPPLRVPLIDRFNYASSDCSARIHGAHKSLKSPFGILTSKKDKYMLSPCSTRDKFVIVELCDDIQIGKS